MPDFKKLENEVEEIIKKSSVKTDLEHAHATRRWVLKLKPGADEALLVAALAHDIERGVNQDSADKEKRATDYVQYKKEHSERSAEVIVKLLNKYGFDQGFVEKVKHLVLKHEEGGDLEVDVLCDADSLSFFETNMVFYFENRDAQATRKKIEFMYGRMSKKAQEFVKDIFYDNSELNNIFRGVIEK